MCKSAGIGGFKTNHSLRATAVTRLYSSRVDEQLVMERTDHCSTEGIRTYKCTSSEQQEVVSSSISNYKKKTAPLLLLLLSTIDVSTTTTATVPFSFLASCNASNMPCHYSTTKAQHAGTFYFSGCTNININFN